MKRRRNLLVALLLLCAMGIGVGYATISGDLTITNNVEIAAQTFDVKFVKYDVAVTNNAIEGNQSDNAIKVEVDGATDATGNLNVQTVTLDVTGMRDVGEAVEVEFTIKNFNHTPMKLGTPIVSDGTLGGLGTITCTPPDDNELAAGEETTVTVRIALDTACTDPAGKTVSGITITINATSDIP